MRMYYVPQGKIEMDVCVPYSIRPSMFQKDIQDAHTDKTVEQVLLDHFNEDVRRSAKLILVDKIRDIIRFNRCTVEETLSEADMPLCGMQVHFVVEMVYDRKLSGIIRSEKQRLVLTYLLNMIPETCGLKYLGYKTLSDNAVLTRRPDRICLDKYFIPIVEDFDSLIKQLGIDWNADCEKEFLKIPVFRRYCPPEYSNRGQMFIDGGYIPVMENGSVKTELIRGAFILINMTLCNSEKTYRETVIHEYIHSMIHVFHAYLQSMGDAKYMAQYCFSNNFTVPQKMDNRTLIEIQARKLTNCAMIPKEEAVRIVEGVIWSYGLKRTPEAMEEAMRVVMDRFQSSAKETRDRLISLGYPEVRGTFIFEDGRQVPAFGLSCRWEPGFEYTLSMEEYRAFMKKDKKFAEIMNSRQYTIVENHICRKGEPYVRINDSLEYEITDFGRTRINEFCMKFAVNILTAQEQGSTGSYNSNKPLEKKRKCAVYSSCPVNYDEKYIKKSSQENAVWHDLINKNTGENANLYKLLEGIREKIGYSQEDVYAKMDITQGTYTSHLKLGDNVENDFIYAWIIAVQPKFWVRDRIITEYVSNQNNIRNRRIKSLLLEYPDISLDFLNKQLEEMNLPTLCYKSR